MKTIETRWEVATYDVWGNSRNGYEVNDVYRKGAQELTLDVKVSNAGTPMEFVHASPSDRQLREIFGLGRVRLETEGDDLTIYVNRERDGYPIGEIRCISHASLSPIKPV